MSFEIQVITDLAVLMVVASLVTIIFHKLKQPIVIGYLIAGIIIGPYTPPFSLITHIDFLGVFAEIGVIMLLFTIGFEFPISKLRSLGRVVIGVSAIEISLMFLVSWGVGAVLGWKFYDTLFLGAALASSSTTIIAKVLGDMGKIRETSSVIMLGILVVEDVAVVSILVMLQNFAAVNTISTDMFLILVLKLILFIGGTLVLGHLFLPKLIDRVAKLGNRELLFILMLGLCFGFAILSNVIGFSVAIGAFLIGVVAARSKSREEINREMDPYQLVFGAIFFVSMGGLNGYHEGGAVLASSGSGNLNYCWNKTGKLRVWNAPLRIRQENSFKGWVGDGSNRGVRVHRRQNWPRPRGAERFLVASDWSCHDHNRFPHALPHRFLFQGEKQQVTLKHKSATESSLDSYKGETDDFFLRVSF
jgi:Kef-type K+ transport system membrane component KefB